MSFFSCIGKKSKKKKASKNEPIDRRNSEISVRKEPIEEVVAVTKDETASQKSHNSSFNSLKRVLGHSPGHDKEQLQRIKTENDRLHTQVASLEIENKMYKSEADKYDTDLKSHLDEIHRLETEIRDMKSRVMTAETESARQAVDNQRLLQKIVGMEENQAMTSRAELQSMITQLEEAELRTSAKPATELSGIRTNPADIKGRKKLTQEDRQLSWSRQKVIDMDSCSVARLSKTEARLSQTEDENKQLREDLKAMLDSHTELQCEMLANPAEEESGSKQAKVIAKMCKDMSCCQLSKTNQEIISILNRRPQRLHSTKNGDILERLFSAEEDQVVLKKNYDSLQESFNQLQEKLTQVEAENEQLKQTRETFKDAEVIAKRLSDQEEDQSTIKCEMKALEQLCDTMSVRVDKLYAENGECKSENDKLTETNKCYKQDIDKMMNEMNTLKDTNKRLTDENKKLSQQLQKRKDTGATHANIDSLKKELNDVKKTNEEYSNRLKDLSVGVMKSSNQLKSLDLDIALPTTIGERFRKDLYEVKWHEAFSIMTGKQRKDEKKALQILTEICTESYLFCKRAARLQIDTLASSLLTPTANHFRSGQFSKRNGVTKSVLDQLPDDLKRRLVHYRCRPSQDLLKKGVHDFLNQIDYDRTRYLRHVSERDLHEITSYVSTCFELSWCMAVQHPPMYLLFKVKHGLEIDEDKFEIYQTRGKRTDFVVWPAIFAEENGPCLRKGVMFGLPERT